MSVSPAEFEARRQETLVRLEAAVRADPRLLALWLGGSLADGTADPLSDIDAWVAVADEALEDVYAEREQLAGRAGRVLASSDPTTPGLRAVHCLLDGPVKLDLFFEAASAVGQPLRPAVRVLVDKAGLTPALRTGWTAPRAEVARIIALIVRVTRQGAAWPVRLLGRGQWSTLAMMELDLINAQVAQLMAVQSDPASYFKNPFALYRLLDAAQQAELDALTADALAALGARDADALKAVHLRVYDALVREGRAACAALGTAYPITAEGDAAIRRFLVEAWPRAEAEARRPMGDDTGAGG